MPRLRSKYSNEKVFLKSPSGNPFTEWADWYGTDGEAVVTFHHQKYLLYEYWSRECVSYEHPGCRHDNLQERINCGKKMRKVKPDDFDKEKMPEPGITLDGTHYKEEEAVDESYSITVPRSFLSPELCAEWLEKLNLKYDRHFVLALDPVQWLAYVKNQGAGSEFNSMISKQKVDYEKLWEELRSVDKDIPDRVVLSLSITPGDDRGELVEKFTELYRDEKPVKKVHIEEN
jgi:hypothetical protein